MRNVGGVAVSDKSGDGISNPGGSPNPSASLITSQNFEAAGWEGDFTGQGAWGNNVARAANAPASGTYALRGNQLAAVTDPITGLSGNPSPTLDFRGNGNIAAQTPDGCYYKFQFRHDDYNQVFVNDGSDEGKLLWFVDELYGITGMFINKQLVRDNTLELVYNNGAAYGQQWASDNWGYLKLYMSNAALTFGANGAWHTFEYYINYAEKYVQVWVDGLILTSSKHGDAQYAGILTADGRSYYDPALTLKTIGFQHWWVRTNNIAQSTDSTGTRAGWQLDDLEVWDGNPNN
jgi:hypothetical protein